MAWADDPVVSDEPRPLKKPLNAGERVAAQRLSFSPEEQAYDAKTEAWLRDRPFLAAEREEWLKKAPDEETRRAMLDEDQKSIPAPTGDGGQPAWMSDPEVSAGSRGEPPKNLKIGREGFAEAMRQALQEATPTQRFGAGVYSTMVDQPALLLQQVFGGRSPENTEAIKASREMASASLPGAIAGGVAGPVGRIVGPVAGPAMAAAPWYAAPAISGSIGAGGALATTPTLPGESRAEVAGMGVVGGVGGDWAARLLSRAAQPIVQSDAVKTLMSRGIVPTIGQASGPNSIVNNLEQKIASDPRFGWMINWARRRPVEEMNLAKLAETVPEGQKATWIKAGRESIDQAHTLMDKAYDDVYGRIRTPLSIDTGFADAVKKIPNLEGIDLTDEHMKQFARILQSRVLGRADRGELTPEVARDIQNSLGNVARKYRQAFDDPDKQALGHAFDVAKQEFRQMVTRQSGTEFKQALDALDKKYAALMVVDRAAGYTGSKEGVFSASALQRATRRSAPATKRFAETAADVLGPTVPDSGTAGRLLLPAVLAGTASGNEYLGGPGWLTAMAAAPLLYSRAGSRYMLGDLIPGQAALGAGLRSTAPYATVAGETLIPKR